jgi:predicted nucleic acid-binding protein
VSVALDTNILIWGGLRPPNADGAPLSSHAAEMTYRSQALLIDLEKKGEKIIVPVVSVAELLVPIDLNQRGAFLAVLTTRFFCPPFDMHAASLAAELWRFHRSLPASEHLDRKLLKADVLIVATAKVAGASAFYSHDAKCRKLAIHAGMKAFDLPTHCEDMFVDAELKKKLGVPTRPTGTRSKKTKKS